MVESEDQERAKRFWTETFGWFATSVPARMRNSLLGYGHQARGRTR